MQPLLLVIRQCPVQSCSYSFFAPITPSTNMIRNSTTNTMNRILAMPAAPAETPVKPKMPATNAMMAKMMAYLSMMTSLLSGSLRALKAPSTIPL